VLFFLHFFHFACSLLCTFLSFFSASQNIFESPTHLSLAMTQAELRKELDYKQLIWGGATQPLLKLIVFWACRVGVNSVFY